jgi:CheY-like chemotaxis protein
MLELIGEATTGLQALSLVRSTTPDVAVIDVGMPEMNGIVLARKVRGERPSVKVVILTGYEDEAHLKQGTGCRRERLRSQTLGYHDADPSYPRGNDRWNLRRSLGRWSIEWANIKSRQL